MPLVVLTSINDADLQGGHVEVTVSGWQSASLPATAAAAGLGAGLDNSGRVRQATHISDPGVGAGLHPEAVVPSSL